MNLKKTITLALVVVLCASQAQTSLTDAFTDISGFQFTRSVPEKPQVLTYSHSAKVGVASG